MWTYAPSITLILIVPAVAAETLSPNLPVLVLSSVIQYCLLMDTTMLGTFNSFHLIQSANPTISSQYLYP